MKIFNKVIFIRHSDTYNNSENNFTGWNNSELTSNGIKELYNVSMNLKKNIKNIDICYTSMLKRAIFTSWLILKNTNFYSIKIFKTHYLNERSYGEATDFTKSETDIIFNEVVKEDFSNIWLNYDYKRPPCLNINRAQFLYRTKYNNKLNKIKIQCVESLKNLSKRVMYFWNKVIIKKISLRKKLLIVAHSNVLKIIFNNISKNIFDNKLLKNNTPIIFNFNNELKLLSYDFI